MIHYSVTQRVWPSQ